MKRIIVLFIILSFYSCKESKEKIILKIEEHFNSYILNQKKTFRKGFIDNEGKFINKSRKDFLSKLDFDLNSDFNIVETYHMFSSKSYYRASIKKGSKVYYFVNGFEIESKIEIKPFEKFIIENPSEACLLHEAEKNIRKLTGEKIGDATFHFSIHIIKKVNGEITNYSSKNLCFMDEKNEPKY